MTIERKEYNTLVKGLVTSGYGYEHLPSQATPSDILTKDYPIFSFLSILSRDYA